MALHAENSLTDTKLILFSVFFRSESRGAVMRRLFTLYKEKTKSGMFWYARFWDEASQKYSYSRSTGILIGGKNERRKKAEEVAEKLCEQIFIPKLPVPHPPVIQESSKVIQKHKTTADTPLVEYLEKFWSPDSEYAHYKRDVKNKPLTSYYIEMNHEDVRRHVEPFPEFSGLTVGDLNKATLKRWMIWLAGRKTMRRKKDGTVIYGDTLSGRRANAVLQSVRVAIRWAADNEEISADPFRRLGEVAESMREKGVLTLEERDKLIDSPVKDYRYRLVMLLGCLCGMRRGEMRGLQWGDIKDGIITIQHNYVDKEGLKLPKYNSIRRVPIPAIVQELLDTAWVYARNTTPESFVFESPSRPGVPVSNNFVRDAVDKELIALGINLKQQEKRNLSPHSLRHTFITLAQLAGIPDVIIRALTGQKSTEVMNRYSHVPKVINFDETRKMLFEAPTGIEYYEAVNG
jgi:integrase